MDFVLVVECYILWSVRLVSCRVYKSIYWSPRNPQFKFTPEEFKSGKAFVQKAVKPDSKVNIVCPNIATVENPEVDSMVPKEAMFENLWIVEKESFQSCDLTKYTGKTRWIFNCSTPLELKYHTLVFQAQSAVSGELVFEPGRSYYFIATSDGSEASLGDTSGGHCNDSTHGVSMRIKFYVCRDENDTTCDQKEASSTRSSLSLNPTVSEVQPPVKTRTKKSKDIWRMLVIALGAALGVSIIIIIIVSRVACVWKARVKRLPVTNEDVLDPEGNL